MNSILKKEMINPKIMPKVSNVQNRFLSKLSIDNNTKNIIRPVRDKVRNSIPMQMVINNFFFRV
jgi:peptide deformylase